MKKIIVVAIVLFSSFCCIHTQNKSVASVNQSMNGDNSGIINVNGKEIITRFRTPSGYERVPVADNSFGAYLRKLPLKPNGAKVMLFNGNEKNDDVHDAVVDMDIGTQDLQQCADAVMRLRGEYLYAQKEYDNISFNLTNGFKADYTDWMSGKRIIVNGNNVSWKKTNEPSNTYKDFRAYMNVVFAYAGTISLSKSLKDKKVKDIAVGDVFIVSGGHAVVVVDVAVNKAGEKLFMIAQSYMPAQDIEILKNLNNPDISPWYSTNIPDILHTPEWDFTKDQLKGF